MNVSDMLLNYAIESGVIEDPVVAEDGLIEQDASELLDAKVDEICRASDLVESLEALTDRYSQIPVSDISFENYQFTLGHILAVSGIDIPTSVICPSLESAEKSEGQSFKDKAKGAIAAIIKWIKEKFAALRDFILRRKKTTDAKADKAKADAKETKEVILQLKHNPRKGYAPGQHAGDEKGSGKHGSDNSANKQNDHLAKDANGKIIGESDVKRNSHGGLGAEPIKLPSYMVDGDGKLDVAKFSHAMAALTKSGPLFNYLKGDMPDGSDLLGSGYANDIGKVRAALEVSVNKLIDDALGGRGHVTCNNWKPEELVAVNQQLADAADLMRKLSNKISDEILVTERNLGNAVKVSAGHADLTKIRELAVTELKLFKKRQGLADGCLNAIVDGLSKVSAGARKAA